MALLESPSYADDDAFERLCREHGPALLALCRRRLGVAGRAEAEDACQETLLRAYRALPTFDRRRPLWPWLATIAANVCTDLHRRRRIEPLAPAEMARHLEPVDVDEVVAGRMRARLVGDAIGALPHQYKRQVWLADVAGWSYADIADHERTSVASVRSSLLRGRKALRERMGELRDEGRLWPLPALVPGLTRLRRRAHLDRADVPVALLPCLPTLAQAAAAAIAIVAAVAPMAGQGPEPVAVPVAASSVGDRVPADVTDRPAPAPPPAPSRPGVLEAITPPGVEAASEIDTTGPWRLVSARVTSDVGGVPVEVAVSAELSCHEQNRWARSACDWSQGTLGPDDPD